MATSDRPSGLTALAVINFIFGCLELLGGIGLIASKLLIEMVLADPEVTIPKSDRAEMQIVADTSWIAVGGVATGSIGE